MQNGIARDFKIKTISLPGEAEQLNHRMQETIFQSTDNTEEPVSCDWADKVSNISCTPSPPTSQEITIPEKLGFGPPPLIRVFSPIEPRFSGGSALVLRPPEEMEWPPNTPNNPSDDSGNRCFQFGVGNQTSNILQLKPDPGASAVDALAQDWSNTKGYAFPPFCLIGRCLSKERVPQIILITPLWHSQLWFPVLMEMITDTPLLLQAIMDLLLDPQGNPTR